MNFTQFDDEYSGHIVKRLQFMDYQICLIESLKKEDENVLKHLSTHWPKRTADVFDMSSTRRRMIEKGGFRNEAVMTLTSMTFVEYFAILEVLLAHYKIALENEQSGIQIDDTFFDDITLSFNELITYFKNLSLKDVGNREQRLHLLLKMRLFEDVRNCIMHTQGKISSKRKRLIRCRGYQKGDTLKAEDYNPNDVRSVILEFLDLVSDFDTTR